MTVRRHQFTLSELTQGLDVTIQGDPSVMITGIATIQQAKPGDLTFLTNAHYRKFLAKTQATAVILSDVPDSSLPIQFVIAKNPHYIYAMIARAFEPEFSLQPGIHERAVIGENTRIHPSAQIAANCVIGDEVMIGEKAFIGPGTVIGKGCELADDVYLEANVTLYTGTRVGKRTRIASGAVIGSQGFGFAIEQGKWHKVPQLGGVFIGEDVDIGANTAIDCGALEDTLIGDGVKLDNLIQIGHNVQIGEGTIIAGCTAIAGSTLIGKHCVIGGACMITGHIQIADQVVITGGSAISKSITKPGMYASAQFPALSLMESRRNTAYFNRLGEVIQRVKELEAKLHTIHPIHDEE